MNPKKNNSKGAHTQVYLIASYSSLSDRFPKFSYEHGTIVNKMSPIFKPLISEATASTTFSGDLQVQDEILELYGKAIKPDSCSRSCLGGCGHVQEKT